MSYYDTIEEDLARAKQILEKGRLEPLMNLRLPPEYQQQLCGGMIYGADSYTAYKLLESFVAEIERLTALAKGLK